MIRIFFFLLCLVFANQSLHANSEKADVNSYEQAIIKAQASLSFPDSALNLLKSLPHRSKTDSLSIEYLRIKASAFYYKGIIDSAITYFVSAYAMMDSNVCNSQYSKITNGLAVVLQSAGMQKNAIDYYSKSLGCAELRNDVSLKLKIFSNLSVLNNEVADYETSQLFIAKAMEVIDEENQATMATLYNTKAQNFIAQDQLDSALKYAELSLTKREEKDLKGKAVTLNNIGYVHSLKGNYAFARDYYERSSLISEKIGDLYGLASLFINLADVSIAEDQLDEAHRFLQNAEILSGKIKNRQILTRMYSSYSKLEEARGNIKEALSYLRKYDVLRDSVIEGNELENIKYAQYGLALSEAQNMVKRIKAEEAIQNETIKRQRIINLFLGIGIAIFIGLASLLIFQLNILSNLRKELTKERDEAKRSADFRRETLNSVVHELRTPMNAVISLADLINVEQDFAEVKKLTKMLSKSSKRLLDTTNNILTYSRIEQGAVDLVLRRVDLSELVQDLCGLLEIKSSNKGLTLSRSIAEKVVIDADRTIVEIILMNLIGNAIKFTEVGGVNVELEEEQDFVRIKVADTGVGIDASEITKIFEPFYQGEGHRSISKEGTGIGLSICKYYADLMNADLSVKSIVGEGSEFVLILKKQI